MNFAISILKSSMNKSAWKDSDPDKTNEGDSYSNSVLCMGKCEMNIMHSGSQK